MEYATKMTMDASLLQEVWRRFRCGDSSCRNTLVEAYLPLVHAAAVRLRAKLVKRVELGDLISSGTIGLMDAVESFDPGRGVKFETYCCHRIRGAMLDEIRSMDWVSRDVRSGHRRLTEAMQILETTTGRRPTDEEVAYKLRVPMKKLRQIQRDSSILSRVSLDRPGNGASDEGCRLGDTLPGREESDPARQRQDLMDVIKRGLSRAERLIILLRYCEGMTLREIGATVDLCEAQVYQIHLRLLTQLRDRFEPNRASLRAAA